MSDTWITIRTFDSPPMAELARMKLSDAGISCRLLNSEVVGMYPLLGNAMGYIPLQVPEQRLEEADQILGGKPQAADLPPSDCENCGEPLDQDGPCPMCGHSSVAGGESMPSAEHHPHIGPADDTSDDEQPSPALSLTGIRELGRSMISVYLWVLFLAGLGLLAMLAEQFF